MSNQAESDAERIFDEESEAEVDGEGIQPKRVSFEQAHVCMVWVWPEGGQ